MKKAGAILIIAVYLVNLIALSLAQEVTDPTAGMRDASGGVLDEEGLHTEKINTSYKPYTSKAEERIEAINEYVGPISKFIFGVELSLSWLFVFSVFLWIVIAAIVYNPLKQLFNMSPVIALLSGFIVATLSLRTFGNKFVAWMTTIADTWYYAVIAILIMTFVAVGYNIAMRSLAKKMKNEKEEQREQKAEIADKINEQKIKASGIKL
jgi:hypothetical protein